MGEYEPHDSRDVTNVDRTAPGEPPRTGPREDAARREAEGGKRATADRRQDVKTAPVEQGDPLGKS